MRWYKATKGDAPIAVNLDRVAYLKDLRDGRTRVYFTEDDHIVVDAMMSDIVASYGTPK